MSAFQQLLKENIHSLYKEKMTTILRHPFLTGWKFELSKLPSYDNFKGELIKKADWHMNHSLWNPDQK